MQRTPVLYVDIHYANANLFFAQLQDQFPEVFGIIIVVCDVVSTVNREFPTLQYNSIDMFPRNSVPRLYFRNVYGGGQGQICTSLLGSQ